MSAGENPCKCRHPPPGRCADHMFHPPRWKAGTMYHIIITLCIGRVTKLPLCFPRTHLWWRGATSYWIQEVKRIVWKQRSQILFRHAAAIVLWLRAGWQSWRKVVCCCSSLRRWEAGSPRLKYWWMMINSCERLKLIQTVLQSDTTVTNGDKLKFTVTWEWTGFSQQSGGFVLHLIKAELKMARTGHRLCHAGLRAWPLLSWRWCTVLGNLFITLRFLLYVSSIFHDRGVNHQQHPVSPVMSVWTCSSICAVVPRGRSHRGAGVTAADEPQQDKRGLQHQQLWLVWNFLNLFSGSFWEAALSMGQTLFCVFFFILSPGLDTAGFHHSVRTGACMLRLRSPQFQRINHLTLSNLISRSVKWPAYTLNVFCLKNRSQQNKVISVNFICLCHCIITYWRKNNLIRFSEAELVSILNSIIQLSYFELHFSSYIAALRGSLFHGC